MASPRILVNILVSGSKALGRAFYEAGRQAAKNVKSSQQAALASDAAGVGNATSTSPTDQLTRQHRMTIDEAQLILNVKKDTPMEQVLKNYEHLFKANSPPAKPEKPVKPVTGKQAAIPTHSHYLQSKVFRAKERWEAELKLSGSAPEAPPPPPPQPTSSTTTPPPS
ncbi:protein transporter [Coprinopsis marcescibilis]|uniref:Mitochondrial import inner membrane translocase subunit TIM16 n=1 Tax=Coprinopsis marcescibilis TaxID=230819 RepID=A0A5C3KPX1_COPMA|nr:protein transporter [Coprinopsis marcescibilis]